MFSFTTVEACVGDASDPEPLCSDNWDIRLHGVLDMKMDLNSFPGEEKARAISALLTEKMDVDSDEVCV